MASIYHGRKTNLLYSDLFKCNSNSNSNRVLEKQQEENIMIMSKHGGSSSSLSSNKSFSCDSSSFGSELGSSENEDEGDFMAELTRQMAECMLQEEEEQEEENVVSKEFEANGHLKDYKGNLKYGINLDDQLPPLEVYELKNQPPIRKERGVSTNKGRRVKGTESTHKKQGEKTEQQHYMQMQYRGREWGSNMGREGGSGMQAIFLDGSKSRNGSTGTGVFLPRATNNPVKPKKKSGCSTVLIPTRVLQALDLHFKRVSDSIAPPPPSDDDDHDDDAYPNLSCRKDESNGVSQLGNHDVEMRLP